ncbi:hypothetical protein niasHS_008779 [Heterodera schachtii]|uniref:B30.2/SPRY domain-containing protein n=1 Tax=Heterodera schachtii TaxID=97005 RepID=A0ABD2J7J6_HETSC
MRDNQKASSPMKNISILPLLFHFPLPIYRWNASDCHPNILLNESTNAIQRNPTGKRFVGFRSCRAGQMLMPSAAGRIGIIYAEYRILFAKNGPISIGLSTKEMRMDEWLEMAVLQSISDNVPSFGTDDVVRCGLNWATRQVFFTKNGQRLNITNLNVNEGTADVYPTVSLSHHGDAVEANFGPNFKYDLSNQF